MTISDPQYDLPINISGGADIWDEGLAGTILTADYFDAATPPSVSGSHLSAWDGDSWVLGELKYWDSTTWQPAILQRWSGDAWVPVL